MVNPLFRSEKWPDYLNLPHAAKPTSFGRLRKFVMNTNAMRYGIKLAVDDSPKKILSPGKADKLQKEPSRKPPE
jgi:hypothetical protein